MSGANTPYFFRTPGGGNGSSAYIGPTVQKFTSGTGQTYVTPAAVLFLKVSLAGGGGGGSGSGVSGGGNGGNGTDTIFGISLMIAKGGLGCVYAGPGGLGGTYITGSTAIIAYGLTGGYGTVGGASTASGSRFPGGLGGDNPIFLGGARNGDFAAAGSTPIPNSGGGGQGGGDNAIALSLAGGGGGGGGGLVAFLKNPAPAYSWTVGLGGAAGTAGVSGLNGATGAVGQIVVEEFYQ